jgi:uncharacterized protein (TIGR02145 family)
MSTKAIFDNIAEHLEEQIDLAENKIVVAVAWFTNKRLFDALCIKAADGVEVKLIISDNEINRNSNIDFGDIQIEKSKLYLIDEEKMHHKFCIIDDYIVITGSYNWSYRAESNFENILICSGNIDLVKKYKNEAKKVIKDYSPENDINPKSNLVEAKKFGRPFIPPSTKKDFECIKIGKQEWMLKNLDVDRFRNGDLIRHIKDKEEWIEAGRNSQPAWCYYDNNPENGKIYGKLYNWSAVNDKRGLAPIGWHVPSDEELTILQKFLGVDYAGYKMKSVEGWDDWEDEDGDIFDGNGDNSSGFNALPGGYLDHYGGSYDVRFSNIRGYASFWSATEFGYSYAWCLDLGCRDYSSSGKSGRKKFAAAASVRCLRD